MTRQAQAKPARPPASASAPAAAARLRALEPAAEAGGIVVQLRSHKVQQGKELLRVILHRRASEQQTRVRAQASPRASDAGADFWG